MKTKLIRLPLLAALLGSSSTLALAAERWERPEEHAETLRREAEHERLAHPEIRPPVAPLAAPHALERRAITRDYVRERLEGFRRNDPVHLRTHAYFVRLIDAGYDPFLVNVWIDDIYGGTIVEGMPGELVTTYYGEPVFVNHVVFAGAPALEWGITLRPGFVERVTIVGGKVVRVAV